MTTGSAIEVRGLTKSYGGVTAVDDVSLEVATGEIFGLLGPNGAGKTTIIECVETLRRPDRGTIRVLGLDPYRDGTILRRRIGVQLQSSALQRRLKLWEALDLFSSLYRTSADWRLLLRQVGLADCHNTQFAKLSGGQQQRAFIALALVNQPRILFLDELTTSLDPHARHAIWDLVRDVRAGGTTVFLTTHFMEEAEQLCDRVAIMNHGRIIALDSPATLIRSSGTNHRIVFRTPDEFPNELLSSVVGIEHIERSGERIVVHGRSDQLVSDVISRLAELGVRCLDVQVERATLEDVFLDLTTDSATVQ